MHRNFISLLQRLFIITDQSMKTHPETSVESDHRHQFAEDESDLRKRDSMSSYLADRHTTIQKRDV